MVTIVNPNNPLYRQHLYRGLSTDTKPEAKNGDVFQEMDTYKLYMFDEESLVWLEIDITESGEVVVVSGTPPIVLPDALAKEITRLVQFGNLVQSGTPTPDAPVDIVCNNGAVKWDSTNQRIYADGSPEVLTISGTGYTQTASVQNLFAVGGVSDEQNIINGHVTRKVGVKVFDGTEIFSKSSAYGKAFLINAASSAWGADRTQAVLCTHFLGLPQTKSQQEDNTCFFNQTGHFYFRVTDSSDTEAFKSWLATQYSAGTPVIVFYVLAEETAETVTVQPLSTNKGNNVVSVTANVPVDLEVEYTKKVE